MENRSRSKKRLDFLLPETQADGLGNYESLLKNRFVTGLQAKSKKTVRKLLGNKELLV
jgi:hypothetical protein